MASLNSGSERWRCAVSRIAACLWIGLRCLPALGGSATPDYARDIRPILEKRCYSCHSRLKQKGGLRLDAGALIHKGGKHGAAVVTGKRDASPLIERVTTSSEEDRMPPEGKPLTDVQIALLRAWIEGGAPYPAGERAPSSPADHWAFQPVKRPGIPAVKNRSWIRNPVDAFILAKLEANGLQPAPAAQPRQLLRRACLDIAGLPPTLAEQDEFARRLNSADWPPVVDHFVDLLLARPQYGERWARHWLDLVRYADSNGYERDAAKPFVWRYRDWVIRAMNEDKPYDRFLVEQIAGDELPGANADTLIATGMLRLGHWDDEPADPETDRYDQLDDIASTVSQSVLGLTIGCARCHDHKFEPLTTRDYYSMIAVFNPLKRPQDGRTELTAPVGTPAELAARVARDGKIAALRKDIAGTREAARARWVASGSGRLPEDIRAAFQTAPGKRTEAQRKTVADLERKLDEEIAALVVPVSKDTNAVVTPASPASGAGKGNAPESAGPTDAVRGELRLHLSKISAAEREIAALLAAVPDPPQAYIWTEPSPQPPATRVLIRGNPKRPGDAVDPAAPAIFSGCPIPTPMSDERTSHRRLAFATWIASSTNPLTARVIVNRVWQQHFGVGLVRTASDFGLMGDEPTHPELLDWLADWFVRDAAWSLKKLHRLILTSNAWRMSRGLRTETFEVAGKNADPENRLLSHLPHRRLEAEAIRDSILAVGGHLNPAMFGPAVFPAIPDAAIEANTDKHSIWKPSPETEALRRTIYVFIKRGLVVPMLEVLDLCDTVNSTARRQVTTVAPQALTLFNGDFVNGQARYFAARLVREAGSGHSKRIDLAFRLALARPPSASEREAMMVFLEDKAPSADSGGGRGLEEMCRVILNLNEFVYPD